MKHSMFLLCALLLVGCKTVKDIEIEMQPVLDEIPASSAREFLAGYTHVENPSFGVCDIAVGSISGYVKGAADPQGYRSTPANNWFVLQSTISVDESAGSVRTVLRLKSISEYLFCAVRMKTSYSTNQGAAKGVGGIVQAPGGNSSTTNSLGTLYEQEKGGLEKALQALHVLGVKVTH